MALRLSSLINFSGGSLKFPTRSLRAVKRHLRVWGKLAKGSVAQVVFSICREWWGKIGRASRSIPGSNTGVHNVFHHGLAEFWALVFSLQERHGGTVACPEKEKEEGEGSGAQVLWGVAEGAEVEKRRLKSDLLQLPESGSVYFPEYQ